MSAPDVFSIESNALPPGTRAMAFEGREALSEPFSYRVWLSVPGDAAESLDAGAVLLQQGRLTLHNIDGSLRRQVQGVWASLELLDENPAGNALYVAELVPTFWKLKLSRHSRVWANKTLKDIVLDVFRKAGFPALHFNERLSGRYEPIPHVCQYRESDFDFLSRWFEREGIYYYFDHTDAGDKLVYLDSIDRHEDAEDAIVPFVPESVEGDSGHEGARVFTHEERYEVASVRLRDHDPLKPTTPLDAREDVVPAHVPAVVRHMEDHFLEDGAGKRLAKLRAGEPLAALGVFRAEGRILGVAPGRKFTLEGAPRGSFNRGYQCVSVEMRGRLVSDDAALRRWVPWTDRRTLWTVATGLADDLQYRPKLKTARPQVSGLEIAHVDGEVESEYAQLDEHGRYLLRFRFDERQREGADGTHSTRVRMLQPHAGEPEGQHFPLRKGTEVMVAFVAGDPDRPVIAGAVHDADRPSPVTSANHSQNVIQTGGENRIEIEDLDGSQYVDVSSPPQKSFLHLGALHGAHDHNYVSSTDGNGLLNTGANLDVTVGGNKHEHVVKTLKETYHATLSSEVDLTVTETHSINMTTTVTGHVQENSKTHTTHVGGKTIERCQSQRTEVAAHLEEKHGQHKVLVDGRLYVDSGTHDATTTGKSECHYGTLLINVSGAFTLTSVGPIAINALNWADNAPIAYRIVTTKRQKVNRADITIHPFFLELVLAKRSMVQVLINLNAWKADVGGIARAVNGLKLDYTGAKVEGVANKVKLRATKFSSRVFLGKTFAVTMYG